MCLGAPFYQTEAWPWPNSWSSLSGGSDGTERVRNGPWGFMEGGQSKLSLGKRLRRNKQERDILRAEGRVYQRRHCLPMNWKVPVGSKAIGDLSYIFSVEANRLGGED